MMTDKLLVYWFPLVLAVGFAATLVGRTRGRVVGALAGLYWIMLAVTFTDGRVWSDPLGSMWMLAGATVIVWVGFWMGSPQSTGACVSAANECDTPDPGDDEWGPSDLVADLAGRFDEWLSANRHHADPWPDFGEFMRTALYTGAGARHVRAYRVIDGGDELYPLRLTDPGEADFPSPRGGIIGHVVTSGRAYYANDPAQGDLVTKLAAHSRDRCVWCFPVRYQSRTVGVVTIGEAPADQLANRGWLRALESLIQMCWATMAESCLGRLAGHVDPVAGVMTYQAFTDATETATREAYRNSEPVVFVHISIGGIRNLYDAGRWSAANKAIAAVSQALRERIRHDDEVGVYEASQFMLMLRRVDSELATLIVEQLVERLCEICGDQDRWQVPLSVHCGVAGSGVKTPSVRDLLVKAMNNSRLARERSVPIVSDLAALAEVQP